VIAYISRNYYNECLNVRRLNNFKYIYTKGRNIFIVTRDLIFTDGNT
jgi:hypothetical protein